MSIRKRTWKTSRGETREAWIVDYVDQDAERHIKTFDRKKEADAYHAAVKVDVRKGLHTAPSKSLTVAEAAEVWVKKVEADDRESTTVRQYRQHVDLHIVPRLGNTKLAQLNVPIVETFRDELLADLSRVTIKRNTREHRKIEVGRDIPTPAEIKRLVQAAAPGRQRALLLVASLCGLRASELRGLRWADVDLKAATLSVRQRADRYGKIGTPKSRAGVRTLPLDPDMLVPELRRWKAQCPPGELVFPTSTGRIEHHSNMLRSFAPVMVAAGVVDKKGEPKYSLHAFRHFFASWCLNRRPEGRELPAIEVQRHPSL
jgi:integrase